MYPTRPARTRASASVDQPRMLAPPPPGEDTGAEDDRRNEDDRDPEHAGGRVGSERESPVRGLTRSDSDQAFLLRQPVHGVHEQIAVAFDAEVGVSREIRVADRRDTCLRLRALIRRR